MARLRNAGHGGQFPKPCAKCGATMRPGVVHSCPLRATRPCASCGRPQLEGNLCDRCKALTDHDPRYDDPEYRRNRRKVLARAGGYCEGCGNPATKRDPLQAAHIISLDDGGTHELHNLRALHRSENLAERKAPSHARRTMR